MLTDHMDICTQAIFHKKLKRIMRLCFASLFLRKSIHSKKKDSNQFCQKIFSEQAESTNPK